MLPRKLCDSCRLEVHEGCPRKWYEERKVWTCSCTNCYPTHPDAEKLRLEALLRAEAGKAR